VPAAVSSSKAITESVKLLPASFYVHCSMVTIRWALLDRLLRFFYSRHPQSRY
jgi:hypothetical protein